MPIDYSKYPPDWKQRRKRILNRANNRCEFCGLENYVCGVRDEGGKFYELAGSQIDAATDDGDNVIQIVLTIAHLDHDEINWSVKDDRLVALCQRCHIRYDIEEKKRRLRKKKAVADLFE